MVSAIALLAGCSAEPRRAEPGAIPQIYPDGQSETSDPVRRKIIATARQMVGVRYIYGGGSPDGFDCSGLVQFAYRSAGLNVPRTAQEQLRASRTIKLTEAAPGDLLFFESPDNSHVAIYLGDGRFVHAPSTSRKVSLAELSNPYFREHFVRAGRMPQLTG
jgi:cell wall-associated NlpC family hydrolase